MQAGGEYVGATILGELLNDLSEQDGEPPLPCAVVREQKESPGANPRARVWTDTVSGVIHQRGKRSGKTAPPELVNNSAASHPMNGPFPVPPVPRLFGQALRGSNADRRPGRWPTR